MHVKLDLSGCVGVGQKENVCDKYASENLTISTIY